MKSKIISRRIGYEIDMVHVFYMFLRILIAVNTISGLGIHYRFPLLHKMKFFCSSLFPSGLFKRNRTNLCIYYVSALAMNILKLHKIVGISQSPFIF